MNTLVVVAEHSAIDYIDSNPVIGKIVEISAMRELEDGNLREPVFRHFRLDKE